MSKLSEQLSRLKQTGRSTIVKIELLNILDPEEAKYFKSIEDVFWKAYETDSVKGLISANKVLYDLFCKLRGVPLTKAKMKKPQAPRRNFKKLEEELKEAKATIEKLQETVDSLKDEKAENKRLDDLEFDFNELKDNIEAIKIKKISMQLSYSKHDREEYDKMIEELLESV
jgi:hypothetical protein